jgi:signal transduction histidine kinase/ligand-binding sensor domain-containing protein
MQSHYGYFLGLCLCVWLALTGPVFGQATTWPHALRFQRFEHNQALSNLAVHTLVQDRFGLLWIGTEDGLNRYDGHSIKRYRHRPDDPYSLPANGVFKLHAARDGTLWARLADRSLCRYDWQQDRFLREPLNLPETSNWRLNILAEDQQGYLWLAGQTTLVRYDPRTKTSRSFALPEVKPPETAPTQPIGVRDLTIDHQGRIWVNVSFRLCRFHPETGSLAATEVSLDQNNPLLAHPNGYLYGAARVNGQLRLLEMAPETARVVGEYPIGQRPALTAEVAANFLVADGDLLWVAINGIGVGRFNTRTKALDYAVYDRTNPRSLAGGEPLTILRDRSGVLWVGDRRQGLSLLTPYAAYFKTYRSDPNRPDHLSLSDDYIRGLCEDRAGNIWVGTQYGGLNCLVARTRTIRHFRHRPGDTASLAHDAVWAVLEDRQGQLWVGSRSGLQTFDPQRERFTTFPLPPNEAGQQPAVLALFEDVDGTLWIGSELHIFAIPPDRRRVTAPLAARLTETSLAGKIGEVQAFYRDAQGALWIGVSEGLLRLAPDGQTLRHFREELGKSVSGIPMVCSFLTDSAGRFWLATKGMGLLQYDPAHDRFQALTERDGLPHNNVYAVLEDRRGRLWMSTDDGIARYEPRTGKLRHYRAEEGLQGREFNRRAYLKTRSGIMFFGGTQGLTAFSPDELEDNPYPPPVVAFVQTGQQTRLVTAESPPVDIPRDERTVTLQLAALDFNAPQSNQYAYRVEGRDAGWRVLDRQSTLTLPDLSPGNWVIHVRASNNDGVWNEDGLRVRLYVQPPWWRTTWAYAGYFLVGTLLAWGGYRLRRDRERLLMRTRIAQARLAAQTRAKQRQVKLSRQLAYKNRELIEANDRLRQLDEVKQRFTAMLVHDLKAPLASVKMLLELLKTLLGDSIDREIQEIMDNTARSAERTLQLIHEMLEVMRAEAGGLQLDLQETNLRTVLESALATILPLSRDKQQTVESELAADLPSLKADGPKLERALVNLLSNAVKYTPEGGCIWLKTKVIQGTGVERGRRFLVIEVSDTGIGIPETELPYIFDPYRQSTRGHAVGAGLGLAIVRNIIAAHGGNVTVRSQVGVGTTFWVTLPLPQSALPNQNEDRPDEPAAAAS